MKTWKTPEGYEAMAETKAEAARKIAALLSKDKTLNLEEVAISDKLTLK